MKLFLIFSFFLLFPCVYMIIPKFRLKNNKNYYIQDNSLELDDKYELFSNFTGFYGLVGPNINFTNASSLMELFTGDGVVQGLFIDNGNLTFQNHIIQTEKFIFEKKHGNIKLNLFTLILGMLRLFPTSAGTANTALHQFQNDTLSLYETDLPYKLNIDSENKTISTIGKQRIKGITSISAHSKFKENHIETISYDIIKKKVSFLHLNTDYEIISKIFVKTNYFPVIHDFISNKDYFIFIDSPLEINIKKILKSKFPVFLNNKLPTYIHIINKHTQKQEKVKLDEGFYVFHFSNFKETDEEFIIQATQIDELDFSNLIFNPKLREIVIDKKTKKVINKKFLELENINMDFPIKIDETKTLFSLIDKKLGFTGFVITKNMSILKKIVFEDSIIIGEPQIINIKDIPYVISFSKKDEGDFLLIINLEDFSYFEIPIPINLINGFHSIFMKK